MRKRAALHMPAIPLSLKWPVSIVGIIAFFYFYGKAAQVPNPQLLPMTWIDEALPLIPWTILLYLSDYFYILLVIALLRDPILFSRACYGVMVGAILSISIFHFYPTSYPRLNQTIDAPWSWLFSFLYGFDAPSNCLPSLHVSNTLTTTWYLTRQLPKHSRLRPALWLWSWAICLSTITTKQHYAIDVAGGICVTLFSLGLVRVLGPEQEVAKENQKPHSDSHEPTQRAS